MDSSQSYQNLLEPGLRAAKKKLEGQNQGPSPLRGALDRKKKLRKIKQKYGGYQQPGAAPKMQFEGDPNG